MFKKSLISILIFTIYITSIQLYAQDEVYDLSIRWGQGGFSDNRSPEGKLGGGQLTLDIKLKEYPVAVSFSTEFYTNRPVYEAYNSYEITNLNTINLLYISKLFNLENTDYFFGGGIGQIEVPKDDAYPDKHYGFAKNIEAGINFKYFKYVGFYGVAKYLKAEKTAEGTKVIDFDEKIILLGITFNFSL